MDETATTEEQLVCHESEMAAMRSDPAFSRVLTLARIVNTIRFAEFAIVTRGGFDSPAAVRQSSSAMFYLGALLWEALNFADRLGEFFRDYESFREELVPILKDPEVRRLRDGLLSRLRNQAVYHHDDAVIPEGLARMHGDEYVLLSLRGASRRDAYYDLADIAVAHYALPHVRTLEEFATELPKALEAITQVALRFAATADRLILEHAKKTGWKRRSLVVEPDAA